MKRRNYGHGKLVRDFTPFRATADKKIMEYQEVEGARLEDWLRRKLVEEAYEVAAANSDKDITEEMADLTEVMLALQKARGIFPEEVEKARIKKRKKRGGFERGIILKGLILPTNE